MEKRRQEEVHNSRRDNICIIYKVQTFEILYISRVFYIFFLKKYCKIKIIMIKFRKKITGMFIYLNTRNVIEVRIYDYTFRKHYKLS